MADEQQEQQHDILTTITTERNQHKLFHVGELRCEIDVRSDGPCLLLVLLLLLFHVVVVLQLSLCICNYR